MQDSQPNNRPSIFFSADFYILLIASMLGSALFWFSLATYFHFTK